MRGDDVNDQDSKIIENTFKPQVITGKVLVTRSPCHFPSDLQAFTAVENYAVREQFLDDNYNVIVFSSQGDGMP